MIEKLHPPFNDIYVVEAFLNLAKELKPVIQNYNVIIGDDISGRLPTLVIANLARYKRRVLGLMPPSVYFINAGSNLSKTDKAAETLPKVSLLISRHKKDGQRILVVTEFVGTGNSISALTDQFKMQGLAPDICVLDSFYDPSKIEKLTGLRVFCGTTQNNPGKNFYHDTRVTGVRSTWCSPVAERRKLNSEERERAREARRDVKLLSEDLWKIIE